MILSNKQITKVLIRLRGCAGWSAPVLFANPRRQVLSRGDPFLPCPQYNVFHDVMPKGNKAWRYNLVKRQKFCLNFLTSSPRRVLRKADFINYVDS